MNLHPSLLETQNVAKLQEILSMPSSNREGYSARFLEVSQQEQLQSIRYFVDYKRNATAAAMRVAVIRPKMVAYASGMGPSGVSAATRDAAIRPKMAACASGMGPRRGLGVSAAMRAATNKPKKAASVSGTGGKL
mmetsp:Transcript_20122/g.48374  ORF Transcript_20122/g.48374 Transcript_20122/m.48374 type:complete len:135 (+) Transcript_20122:477-881(+)